MKKKTGIAMLVSFHTKIKSTVVDQNSAPIIDIQNDTTNLENSQEMGEFEASLPQAITLLRCATLASNHT